MQDPYQVIEDEEEEEDDAEAYSVSSQAQF